MSDVGIGGDVFNVNAYHSTQRVEYPLSNEWVKIKLAFPSMKDVSWSKFRGHCMKIDHCQIDYAPQVPINASGSVIIVLNDTRMLLDEQLQAEYTFPLRCPITLNYYASSYFSLKDAVPWECFYKVEDSSVKTGLHFAQFKARVKLSTAKKSSSILFRPPSVSINSKEFSMDHVDFRHVAVKKPERLLCRSSSMIVSRPRIMIEPGESWATKSMLSVDDEENSVLGLNQGPYKRLESLGPDAIDPGPSASQVGFSPTNFVIEPKELASIVADAVAVGSQVAKQNEAGPSDYNTRKRV
uniref:Movement protein BC1 n=1 Tax=Camellia chlorotic dwarf-associated virus TaxID=2122733 RepID=A0A5J6D432_9GEMI|nr:putative movement protein [Camellia chlorotic dwarf-associated virus]